MDGEGVLGVREIKSQMARTKQFARNSGHSSKARQQHLITKPQSQREREKEINLIRSIMTEQRREEKQEEKKDQPNSAQLAAIVKERELIAQVLLIRKEYEETVLPKLPVSIQFTGAMVLGSLLPSVTVELRKGQLEDAEKQVLNQQ